MLQSPGFQHLPGSPARSSMHSHTISLSLEKVHFYFRLPSSAGSWKRGDISSWNCGNKFIFKEDLVPARRVCQKPHVTVRSGSLAARGLCNPEKPIHLHKDLKTPHKCLCAHSFWNFHNLEKKSFIRSKLSAWCGVGHPCFILGK